MKKVLLVSIIVLLITVAVDDVRNMMIKELRPKTVAVDVRALGF